MDTISPTTAPAAPDHGAANALKGNGGLFLIAVFELVKTVLFLVAAAGVFHLVKRDTQVELTKLLHVFRINGDWKLVRMMLKRADVIDPYKVRISIVLVVYAILHATEGLGLLMRKRWAEYFTVIMTAIPLPYEIFLLIHHNTHSRLAPLVPEAQRPEILFTHWVLLKMLVLLGNAAIVGYLVYHLYKGKKHGGESGTALPPLAAPGGIEQSGQPG